jgi:cephalosporin hydroxylase
MTETSNTPYTKFYAHRKMRSASLDHSDGGYTGLKKITEYVNDNTTVKVACEVGCYLGESLTFFAENFPNVEKFYAVDPFDSAIDVHGILTPEVEVSFLKNIESYQCIEHIRDVSLNAAKQFENETFDFIYIDANHDYESIRDDINAWAPKIKVGGFISFHDVNNENIIKAIKEVFNWEEGLFTEDNSGTFKIK